MTGAAPSLDTDQPAQYDRTRREASARGCTQGNEPEKSCFGVAETAFGPYIHNKNRRFVRE
jgi:hypothetical protein